MYDKMKAKCAAVEIDSGGKNWIDGACALTDADGDVIFSTFDTRDLDKAQPKMDCGTHLITGGTGKYKGMTGVEDGGVWMNVVNAVALLIEDISYRCI